MQIYEELVARGLIAQVTDENEIRELDGGSLHWLLDDSVDRTQLRGARPRGPGIRAA